MSSKLILRLAKNLNFVHSTNYIQITNEIQQQPIDFVLKPYSGKKWTINRGESIDKQDLKETQVKKMNQITRESYQKIFHLKVPINFDKKMQKPVHQTNDFFHYSYSIGFMVRFDNNLMNYSPSPSDSYIHLFSVNLENENSSFEIWLNSNGSILFMYFF